MLLLRLGPFAIEAGRAAVSATCATVDRRLPLMSMLTIPYFNLAAADCVVMSSTWVLVAKLGSYDGVLDGKRVVVTDVFAGTEGTQVRSCINQGLG